MSRIYLAVIRGPAGFSKLVVIKRLHEELAADPEFRTMFHEEARLSARLNHPNIVQVNEVGLEGHFDIEMEYLEGHSLEALVRRGAKEGGLPEALHLRILSDALAGLHYAHEFRDYEGKPLHLVHRDVSPHNIFVTYEGHVKLVDFGIAKAADSAQQTRTGVLKGKCAYMAPEQLLTLPIDRRIDIYAVGVMLWQVASKRKLWKGMSDIEIFQRVAAGEIPAPSTVNPEVPPELEAICLKALARNPAERYATCEELRAAINEYLRASAPRIDERDVSQYVSRVFDEERRQIRAAIEVQMRKENHPSQPSIQSLPRMPHTTLTSSTIDPTTSSPSEPPRPVSRSRGIAVAVAAAAVVVGVASGIYFTRQDKVQTAGTKGSSASSSAPVVPITSAPLPGRAADTAEKTPSPSGSAAQAAEFIELTIAGTPEGARFSVDDMRLPSNPAKQRFARDGKVHRIVGTAPGYAPAEQYVKFAAPTGSVHLTLPKLPAGAPYRPARTQAKTDSNNEPANVPTESSNKTSAAGSSPQPEKTPPPNNTAPKGTSIDQDNPYGK